MPLSRQNFRSTPDKHHGDSTASLSSFPLVSNHIEWIFPNIFLRQNAQTKDIPDSDQAAGKTGVESFRVINVNSLLEKSSNTLIIGSIVQGRYQILSKLKGGALSRTYLVQDLAQPNDPKCVLKHYPYNKEIPRLYKTNMRLFLKEAKHLQVLSVHPQIPRLIDYFGITDQGWYLVQELVDGRLINNTMPLSEYSNNCWSAYQVAQFIHDLCETLQFVHSQKIIHCDLKPNNIIRRSSDDRLVIIDFGSAQYMPGFQANEDLSLNSLRTKITVSPSGYLAPEQMTGQPQPCSDFYALGIMAIQAWTGLDPARMKKDSHTGEVVWDQYVKIDDPHACRELVGIVSKLVQPDIGDRYQETKDILADLDIFLNTFHPADEEIEINYSNISFEDTTLFQKPDLPLEDITLSKVTTLTDDEFILPPEASKDTFIQDNSTGFEQTLMQDQGLPLADDDVDLEGLIDGVSFALEDGEEADSGDFNASDLPPKFKRPAQFSLGQIWEGAFSKSFAGFGKTKDTPEAETTTVKRQAPKFNLLSLKGDVALVAAFSVSVVIVNALLIAFGLQQLIKGMATADIPQPDNDFQRAQDAYAQGDLEEAIAIAKAIPQKNPAYQNAQTNASQWGQELQNQEKIRTAIASAHTAKNWQEVVKQAKNLGQKSPLRQQLKQFIDKAQFEIDVAAYQRLQKAYDLATNFDFNDALKLLKEAPPNSKFANVITDKVKEYEAKKLVRNQFYLQQAVNHAEARDFRAAVAFLEKIPADSVHNKLAQSKIVEYTEKQEIKEAYERWTAARSNHAAVQLVTQNAMAYGDPNPGMMFRGIV